MKEINRTMITTQMNTKSQSKMARTAKDHVSKNEDGIESENGTMNALTKNEERNHNALKRRKMKTKTKMAMESENELIKKRRAK